MTERPTQRTTPQAKLGLLAELARSLRLAWRLLVDRRVSIVVKLAVPALAAAYLLWPVDFLPDFLPALGQLDDLAILALAIKLFIDLSPPDIVRQHRADMTGGPTSSQVEDGEGEVVDSEYRVID